MLVIVIYDESYRFLEQYVISEIVGPFSNYSDIEKWHDENPMDNLYETRRLTNPHSKENLFNEH